MPSRLSAHMGSRRLPVSLIRSVGNSPYHLEWWVDFRLRISHRIQSQNRKGCDSCVKGRVPNWFIKKRKIGLIPCPFKYILHIPLVIVPWNSFYRKRQHVIVIKKLHDRVIHSDGIISPSTFISCVKLYLTQIKKRGFFLSDLEAQDCLGWERNKSFVMPAFSHLSDKVTWHMMYSYMLSLHMVITKLSDGTKATIGATKLMSRDS